MKKIVLFILVACILTACDSKNGNFVCHFGVPGGDEYDITKKVSDYIEKNYGNFANRNTVERTHEGKTYYWNPGCVPHYTFYEITQPGDIKKIEDLTKAALHLVPIDEVHLTFYEKQTFSEGSKGGGFRWNEKKIKSVTVSKHPQQ